MSKLAHSHGPTMDEIEAREIVDDVLVDDEATRFAVALLVPREMIMADLDELGPRDIDDDSWIAKLATRYRVSRGVMNFRLRMLGRLADAGA